MFSTATYTQRRDELKRKVGKGLILLLGNDETGSNYEDNTYDFRQDSSFLYYYGLPYAGLTAVIDLDNGKDMIFGDELTIDDIVWMGVQPTLHEKASMVGVDTVLPTSALAGYLADAVKKGQDVHYLPPYRAEHRLKLQSLLGIAPYTEKPSITLIKAIVSMRSYKSSEEIVEIERACDVSADMHMAAMRAVAIGKKEYEIAAAIEATAQANGCRLSFPTIATTHGQTLHNHYHGHTINPGDMLLVDAGAETQMGYAGDMSSTICAGKHYTQRQKDIYNIQLATHHAAVAALRPGRRYEEVYDMACAVMCDGLKAIGLMKGDPVEAVKAGAHAMFMPHGLGHMMGLDVHDMENLGEVWVGYNGQPKSTQFGRKSLRLARELEPGFVLTIEPGIYFIPELIDMWKAEKKYADFINYDVLETYRDFSGIRNEEDYLITADGSRRLGKKKPMTIEEVEAMKEQ